MLASQELHKINIFPKKVTKTRRRSLCDRTKVSMWEMLVSESNDNCIFVTTDNIFASMSMCGLIIGSPVWKSVFEWCIICCQTWIERVRDNFPNFKWGWTFYQRVSNVFQINSIEILKSRVNAVRPREIDNQIKSNIYCLFYEFWGC